MNFIYFESVYEFNSFDVLLLSKLCFLEFGLLLIRVTPIYNS